MAKKEQPEENQPENIEMFAEEETQVATLNVKNQSITNEMETSYLEYAMSVIVSRALPDVRDGLKPVHRRILYAMNEIGLKSKSVDGRNQGLLLSHVIFHPVEKSANRKIQVLYTIRIRTNYVAT